MFAAYIALDSFGTATNVTGDGAIAMIMNKLTRGHLGTQIQDPADEALEVAAGSEAGVARPGRVTRTRRKYT